MAFLSITREGAPTREVAIHDAVIVGRDPTLPVCLNDTEVSRRHAIFLKNEIGTVLQDLGSRNGVFLNGLRLPIGEAHALRDGDEVLIGFTLLVYRDTLRLPVDHSRLPA